jgi:hypothetical protein
MAEIVHSVRQVGEIIGQIGAGNSEQSQGMLGMQQAIVSMDEITQQNLALVQQAAAAASTLQRQALYLSGSRGHLQTGRKHRTARRHPPAGSPASSACAWLPCVANLVAHCASGRRLLDVAGVDVLPRHGERDDDGDQAFDQGADDGFIHGAALPRGQGDDQQPDGFPGQFPQQHRDHLQRVADAEHAQQLNAASMH